MFILFDMVATGAFLMCPKVPMLHHFAKAKKATDMFRHPKPVKRRKGLGCKFNSIPINIVEGCGIKNIPLVQVGL
jgi:hypothetical protein